MTSPAPILFDRGLVRRRLGRALAGPYPAFLLDRAAAELEGRLAAVTRSFLLALDLGTPGPQAAAALVASGRVGQVIRFLPAPAARGREEAGSLAVVDEEALPVAPARLDLVASLLSLHAVNDLPGALTQVRRALRPDGLFLACLFGGETLRELRHAFAAAESDEEGGASPRVAPFADIRALGALLQRAGFALPVADVDRVTVRYGDLFGLVADLRSMGVANPLAARRRTPLRRATLMRAAAIYAEGHSDPDGRVRATFDLAWLSGWAPHESQQQPLRPGSARMRLAEALGVPEYAADETGGST